MRIIVAITIAANIIFMLVELEPERVVISGDDARPIRREVPARGLFVTTYSSAGALSGGGGATTCAAIPGLAYTVTVGSGGAGGGGGGARVSQ